MQETINFFLRHHKKIILIKQIPELNFDPVGCLIGRYRKLYGKDQECVTDAIEVANYLNEYEKVFDQVVMANPGIEVWDPWSIFCGDKVCIATEGGRQLYNGDYHLSKLGSDYFAKKMFIKLNHEH